MGKLSTKPFHESILDAIGRTTSADQISVLGTLIMETKIPKNHDTIVEAWLAKAKEFGLNANLHLVTDSVLEQKPEAVA